MEVEFSLKGPIIQFLENKNTFWMNPACSVPGFFYSVTNFEAVLTEKLKKIVLKINKLNLTSEQLHKERKASGRN
jgi:hypothetical protein